MYTIPNINIYMNSEMNARYRVHRDKYFVYSSMYGATT